MKILRVFKFSYYSLLATALFTCTYSCTDSLSGYSVIPSIELSRVEQFKDFQGKDSILAITFTYKDGDGNIGLDDSDTFPPFNAGSLYQYNLLVDIWDYSDGKRLPILTTGGEDTLNFNRRIPDLEPTGKIKEISGDITVRYDSRSLILYPDTIECELTLVDRDLNFSNTIRTNLIFLSH